MQSTDKIAAVERLDADHSTDAFQIFLHNQRYNFALEQLAKNEAVLEVGTGVGCFSRMLVNYGVAYSGLDFDAGACDSARAQIKGRGIVVQGNAQQLPFADAAFATVICFEVLEHLANYRKAVAEIFRCLQPGGRAIISVPYRKRGGPNPLNPFHLYEPGEAELRSAFKQYFRSVDVLYQSFQETTWMKLARKCHVRRLLGLVAPYRDLAQGVPSALNKVKITHQDNGLKISLLLVAGKGSKADSNDVVASTVLKE